MLAGHSGCSGQYVYSVFEYGLLVPIEEPSYVLAPTMADHWQPNKRIIMEPEMIIPLLRESRDVVGEC